MFFPSAVRFWITALTCACNLRFSHLSRVVEEYGAAMRKMVESQKQDNHAEKIKVGNVPAQTPCASLPSLCLNCFFLQALQAERDQVEEDLRSTEKAFSDLHRKYEKAKEVIGKQIAEILPISFIFIFCLTHLLPSPSSRQSEIQRREAQSHTGYCSRSLHTEQ